MGSIKDKICRALTRKVTGRSIYPVIFALATASIVTVVAIRLIVMSLVG